jgi:hypothetical protein
VFWGVLVVSLCVLVFRVVRMLDEVIGTVAGSPTSRCRSCAASTTPSPGVNVELARVDTIVAGVQSITATTDNLAQVVHASVSNPLIKAAAFASGTARAARAFRRASHRPGAPREACLLPRPRPRRRAADRRLRRPAGRRRPRRPSPVNIAGEAGRVAGSFSERLRYAAEQGRIAAEAREAELRARYDVPTMQRALER